ncbi:hypothetical protein PCASD_03465 [Puccinia coronata f. sp. avenae]|uniref:Cytochrome b5 heme-binding domain-containing protein n=1 Tax=Puccinia coronata f. sp. avenae TaxID=200324 RepID=A0A2N5V7T2_9BASI|nr:hypothetical protein PCASD_23066 [Puccinia coronata f. sp. avenae]PLW46054.1 hypothetical protein PCASD_03465 [Puccinia coronata f. sp. avenae]
MLLDELRSVSSLDQLTGVLAANKLWVACHLVLLSLLTLWALTSRSSSSTSTPRPSRKPDSKMTPDPVKLDSPKDTPFTPQELSQFDGSDPSKSIYVAIKGIVFDVSSKRDVYGPGGSYHVFAGKDGSKGLGKSSLKPEDAVPDYSSLSQEELKVLDDWVAFFKKRYNIIGKVVQS